MHTESEMLKDEIACEWNTILNTCREVIAHQEHVRCHPGNYYTKLHLNAQNIWKLHKITKTQNSWKIRLCGILHISHKVAVFTDKLQSWNCELCWSQDIADTTDEWAGLMSPHPISSHIKYKSVTCTGTDKYTRTKTGSTTINHQILSTMEGRGIWFLCWVLCSV